VPRAEDTPRRVSGWLGATVVVFALVSALVTFLVLSGVTPVVPVHQVVVGVFVLNALPSNATNVTLDLQGLIGVQGALRLRDVWQRRDLGTVQGTWTVTVPALDSLLVRLSPAA
jgi:hypothetical protein